MLEMYFVSMYKCKLYCEALSVLHTLWLSTGMFGPIDIGRVYVNDPDDWDLPDKTFTFLEPKWMEAYFK